MWAGPPRPKGTWVPTSISISIHYFVHSAHTFTDYVSKHIGAAATLKRLGEPIAELFHKQQFIKNITCDDLKVQAEFATSMIGEWDLDKIHHYFSSMVTMKRFDANKEKSEESL